jgi:osmotically inducible lipoprotein OsmB
MRKLGLAVTILATLASCGRDPGTRAGSGALIGAGAGAGISAIAGGNPAVGALGGAAVGAIGGAATAPRR